MNPKLEFGTGAMPISSVGLVGSIPIWSPALIGRLAVNTCSPVPDGVAPPLVPAEE